uniref:Uncharacterized protein n=1 Tax=Echinococcus granulosus TaxID=6210 RepID=A0A068WTU1_ECHGR|nr:hypothetical protein EgrG_000571700 [Echinococcus granulosus]
MEIGVCCRRTCVELPRK